MMQLALFSDVTTPAPRVGVADLASRSGWWVSPSGFHHCGDAMLIPNVDREGLYLAPGFTIVLFVGGRVSRRVETTLDVDAAREHALCLAAEVST